MLASCLLHSPVIGSGEFVVVVIVVVIVIVSLNPLNSINWNSVLVMAIIMLPV